MEATKGLAVAYLRSGCPRASRRPETQRTVAAGFEAPSLHWWTQHRRAKGLAVQLDRPGGFTFAFPSRRSLANRRSVERRIARRCLGHRPP